jgi:hypothetical protein
MTQTQKKLCLNIFFHDHKGRERENGEANGGSPKQVIWPPSKQKYVVFTLGESLPGKTTDMSKQLLSIIGFKFFLFLRCNLTNNMDNFS